MTGAAIVALLFVAQKAAALRPPWTLDVRNAQTLHLPAVIYESVARMDRFDPKDVAGATADLNSDGTIDYIVRGPKEDCGTGGCPYHLYDGRSGKSLGSVFGGTIIVRPEMKHGYPVVQELSHGGAGAASLSTYEFDGTIYRVTSSRRGNESTLYRTVVQPLPRCHP
jgi:hypothetical protein